MSALPSMRAVANPSIADAALERLPQHLFGDTAWVRSATRHCTRELLDAISGGRSFRVDRIIRALATSPTIDEIEAVFSSVCDAIVADAYQRRDTQLSATLNSVEKARRTAAQTLTSLRESVDIEPIPDRMAAAAPFVRMIAVGDPLEAARADACAALAARMGSVLGLDDVRLERLTRAARLQNVGASALSYLRRKAGALDPDERDAVMAHPAAGAQFCASLPALADIAPIVAAHHEHFDGSGYGSGLRGEEIPLEARIIAVADAFLAMTSPRADRATLDVFAALKALQDGSGTQFDPAVVAAFCGAVGRPAIARIA